MTTTLQRRERQLVGTVLQLDHIHGQSATSVVRRIDDPDTASRATTRFIIASLLLSSRH